MCIYNLRGLQVANPRLPNEKKPEEKKEFLGPMQGHIASIIKSAGEDKTPGVADPYRKRNAYLEVLKTKLGAAADKALDDEIKTGSLGRDALKQKIPDTTNPSNAALEARWLVSRDTLLDEAKVCLDVMKPAAGDEIKKLFNPPVIPPAVGPEPFDQQRWKKLFNDRIAEFKQKIQIQTDALINAKADILRQGNLGPPVCPWNEAETKHIEAQSTQQLNNLKELETHFVKEVEKQRDTAVYEAMATAKVKDGPPPGVAGLARGIFLNPNQDLTLEEHAERLRLSKIKFIYKVEEEGLIWDKEELADFKNNGIASGMYVAYIAQDQKGEHKGSYGKKFEITDTGIIFKEGRTGNTVKHFDQILDVFYAKTAKDKGTLTIEKNVSLAALQTLAEAVSWRKEPAHGKEFVALEIDNESIKYLLKQTRLNITRNSPEEIAKVIVGLQGFKEPKIGEPDYATKRASYDAQLNDANERVKKLGGEIKQEKEAEKSRKHEAGHGSSPVAKGRK